jgi:hypothetical protein
MPDARQIIFIFRSSLLTVVPASADMVTGFGLDSAPVWVCGQAEHDRPRGRSIADKPI